MGFLTRSRKDVDMEEYLRHISVHYFHPYDFTMGAHFLFYLWTFLFGSLCYPVTVHFLYSKLIDLTYGLFSLV